MIGASAQPASGRGETSACRAVAAVGRRRRVPAPPAVLGGAGRTAYDPRVRGAARRGLVSFGAALAALLRDSGGYPAIFAEVYGQDLAVAIGLFEADVCAGSWRPSA